MARPELSSCLVITHHADIDDDDKNDDNGDGDNGVKVAWEEVESSISLKHQSSRPIQMPRLPHFHP